MTDRYFLELIQSNAAARRLASEQSFATFFSIYFQHYIRYESAPFHHEIYRNLEDATIPLMALIAFRGSGKSTIVSLAFVLWSIMCRSSSKFVVIASMTQEQARQLLRNMRTELETNELLRNDFGPIREEENEWRQMSLVLEKFGAKIMAVSVDQSVRSLRHREHRPSLIVCDDLEDLQSTNTFEGRRKTYNWFTGELLPMGDIHTRTIVIGNLLHDDALLRRLQRDIAGKKRIGIYNEYPLLDRDGNCLWRSKFPTPESIERERQRIGNEEAWQREYLLRILPDAEQVIRPSFIRTYDVIPADLERHYEFTAMSIDPAIAQSSTADRTGIVCARVYFIDGHYHFYVLPHVINERLTMLETLERVRMISGTIDGGKTPRIYVEEVAFQGGLTELIRREGILAEGVKIGGSDKTMRLKMASLAMEAGRVFFPEKGAHALIDQLLGFPRERFDDLVDAFSQLINTVTMKRRSSFGAVVFGRDGSVIAAGGCFASLAED